MGGDSFVRNKDIDDHLIWCKEVYVASQKRNQGLGVGGWVVL